MTPGSSKNEHKSPSGMDTHPVQPRFFIPKRAKPNRYRPVFPTAERELSPKKYDLTNCKQHDRPVPSHQRKPKVKKEKEKKEEKEEKVEQKKEKKKNQGRIVYADLTGIQKQVKEVTAKDRRLKRVHPTIALTLGTPKTCIMAKLESDSAPNPVAMPELAVMIPEPIQSFVEMLNELRVQAFWTCALWIDMLLTTAPTDLTQLLNKVLDSQKFIYGLGTLLYHGKVGSRADYVKNVKKYGQENVVKPSQLQAYEYFCTETGFEPLKTIYPRLTVGKSSQMVMRVVQAALRSHYRNAQFDSDKPAERSSIQFFFEQNATAEKYVDFPRSAFSPQSLYLTEDCLLSILWSNLDVREEIGRLLNLGVVSKKKNVVDAVLSEICQDHNK
ncbi:hypothetical protein BCR41DRAFT_375506 [Lobosporangium transversale]|uniref:Uncharacterized protein n=1 Tax=Lobosporangium transversale TaxID=64571 RepID=A0A1Y2G8G6_9FUNG|nr:hypothetical protein BCR41DRAFT_375506 [Lobosporangium transversale]ORY98423.1 hypothetical protein BCR41DRAFT_375506 [Lobosporangium transversale]|eukprot:XP_021875794.1 hypothetical protein BCR41DRAFT_375506 [Lobosporangium transversale]